MSKPKHKFRGRGGAERSGGTPLSGAESNESLFHFGFTCNMCMHRREVYIDQKSGTAVDFKAGSPPWRGGQYINYGIIILPNATMLDIAEAVGKGHQTILHPNNPNIEIQDVRN